MNIPLRPLGIIKDLVEAVGLDVTYVYDDLIFVEHNAFLLQMGSQGEDVLVWFNTDSHPSDRPGILAQLCGEAEKLSLRVVQKGTYSMRSQEEGESFQLEFTGIDS